MPRCCFTALLGANAGDDQAADTVLHEPDVEAAADESAMAAFVEGRVRREGKLRKGNDATRGERKGSRFLDVKNLQYGNFASCGAADECLQTLHKLGHVCIAPIRSMAERLLGINYEKCGCGVDMRMAPGVDLSHGNNFVR
jgi:hypothetical protein